MIRRLFTVQILLDQFLVGFQLLLQTCIPTYLAYENEFPAVGTSPVLFQM